MKKIKYLLMIFVMVSLLSCYEDDSTMTPNNPSNSSGSQNQDNNQTVEYKILSLGDSYTIGQSVCDDCRFPVQLRDSLLNSISNSIIDVNVIAQTGWRTDNLIDAIEALDPEPNQDLVTLLIGVNNQFQNVPFSTFEEEFVQLITKATELAKGNKNNLIVVSIPDYAFTPFGQSFGNPEVTSMEIDEYNTFTENYCLANAITFLNITDITREGLDNPDLVAVDNLHPSELAYSRFVERLLPIAIQKID